MKNNKLKLILTSIAALLPMLFGLCVFEKLPETLPIHWNINGEVDGFAPKTVLVFIAPIILLLLHLVCIFITKADNKNRNQNEKIMGLIYYIVPLISIVVSGFTYSTVLGFGLNATTIVMLLLGVLLLFLGNYMPKIVQNRTVGIKIYWTLNSEENWNLTHRFTGRLWFLFGFILIILAFIPFGIARIISTVVLMLSVLAPFVYSYITYKKEKSLPKE